MLIPINGAKYNTRALQQANFTNIQVKGNTLVGEEIKKTPLKSTPLKSEPVKLQPAPKTLPETKVIKNAPYSNKLLSGTGIQLTGNATDVHKAIAAKYSPYFKTPIAISVVPNLDNGSLYSSETTGRTSYYEDGSRRIQVNESSDPKKFELDMLHEIAHQVFHYDEDSAWNYAKQMMSMYGNN